MSDNVYQTPKAAVDIPQEALRPYYVVSNRKFWVLYVATFGVYHLYWFYKNWQQFKSFTGMSAWPVARGIFSIFFAHSLFGLIRDSADEQEGAPHLKAGLLATVYVILSLISSGTERLASRDLGSPYTDFISILAMPLVGWVLYQVQKAANAACKDPLGETNNVFTAANVIWIVIGVLFWAMVLFGLYAIATDSTF